MITVGCLEAEPANAFGARTVTASVAPPATLPPSAIVKSAVPALDGKRVIQSISFYTPIWSDADAVYVADSLPVTDLDAMSVVIRYPKSGTPADGTVTQLGVFPHAHDNQGHASGSVTVTDRGTVLATAATHPLPSISTGIKLFASDAKHDVSSFTLLPSLTGQGDSSSYRRFFRDPHSGATYLLARGSQWQAILYRWDEDRQIFRRVDRPGTLPLGDGLGDGLNDRSTGGYGHEIAFSAPAGADQPPTMWCAPEFVISGTQQGVPNIRTGSPRRDISLMRSDDGGHTWRNPVTNAVVEELFRPTGPAGPGNVNVVFPAPPYDQTKDDYYYNYNATLSRVGVAANGHPVVVAAWANPDEFPGLNENVRMHRSLWAATLDPQTGVLTRTKLLQNTEMPNDAVSRWNNVGDPTLAYTKSGTIVVVACATHGGGNTPAGFSKTYLFTSEDGYAWRSYVIESSPAFPRPGITGAYIDPEGLERDGVVRLYPTYSAGTQDAEVWEVTIPEVSSLARRPKAPEAPLLSARGFDGRIDLSWITRSDGGSPITGFSLYRSATHSDPARGGTGMGQRSYIRGGIDLLRPNGTDYWYWIYAKTAHGASIASNVVKVSATAATRALPTPTSTTPTQWFRTDDFAGRTALDSIGTWTSSIADPTGVRQAAIAFQAPTSNGWFNGTDSRPRLIADGPNGSPALRFSRADVSRLVVPSAAGTSAKGLTVLTVARMTDHSASAFIANADASGAMVGYGPYSRVSHQGLDIRFADPAGDAGRDSALRGRTVHTTIGVGPWKVFVTQWRTPFNRRFASGQINRCLGGDPVETPYNELLYDPASEAPLVTASAPLESAPWMTIGAVQDTTGETLTSAVDIAEVLRFDTVLTRPQIRQWVEYLLAVHGLPMTNAIPLDTGEPWDPMTDPRPCLPEPNRSLDPHSRCTSIPLA